MCTAFFHGCKSSTFNPTQYTFLNSTQVVDVDADTKSFRVVVKWLEDGDSFDLPSVSLNTRNTTARHNKHFINYVDTVLHRNIGEFTAMGSDNLYYREVELMPENIDTEVSICYVLANIRGYDPIGNIEIILRPKANNN